MQKDYLKNSKKLVYKFFFIALYVYSFFFVYLNYDIVLSPDFDKYIQYFEYYSGVNSSTNLEQGNLYFYISYILTLFFKVIFNNYFNYEIMNISLLFSNFLIFLFGLFGLKKYLTFKNISYEVIYLTLIITSFVPISFQLRMSFKPEILAYSLLIWSIYFIESYFYTDKKKKLNLLLITLVILLNLKISITVMISIFFLIFLSEKRRLKKVKENYKKIILFLIGFLIVFSENFILNDSLLHQARHDEKYDNQAELEFFTNFNLNELKYNPHKNFHNNSFRAITLLDTFSDYFELYWNADHTSFNKYRKDFVIFEIPSDVKKDRFYEVEYSKQNKELKIIGNISTSLVANDAGENILDELRMKTSFFLSSVLFLLSAIYIISKKQLRYLYLGPFIGVTLISLSAAGLFTNNFDPIIGDSVKPFYYGFFIVISFSMICSNILLHFDSKKIIVGLLMIILFLFILGLPQSYNEELIDNHVYKNSLLPTCQITSIMIDNYEFNSNRNCQYSSGMKYIKNDSFENLDFRFVISRIPFFNFISLILLISYYFKIKEYED